MLEKDIVMWMEDSRNRYCSSNLRESETETEMASVTTVAWRKTDTQFWEDCLSMYDGV